MIYEILKVLVGIILKIFFSRMYFHNKAAIPQKGPVILAMNHPTAFIDPIFICTHIRPTTHFILRGDLFANAFNRWFLNEIRTIPIFRKRDGFANLKKNEASLEYCYELLHHKAHIIILAEGETKHEKRLRPIQKGTARMAFGTYEKYGNEDILIIPVGLNYTDSVRFRSEMMVSVGTPIAIADYMEVYNENPRKAVLQITREIQRQLKERVVHIADPADDAWVDQLLLLNRNERLRSSWPPVVDDDQLLREEVKLAQQANAMEGRLKQEQSESIQAYFKRLGQLKITDRGMVQPEQYRLANTMFLLAACPFFFIGYLSNWLPFTLARRIAEKKVKRPEFHSSVRLGACLAVYCFQFIVFIMLAVLIAWMWKNVLPIVVLMSTPLFGFFAVHYQDIYQRWNEARKAKSLPSDTRKALLKHRSELLEVFRSVKASLPS
ncbi:MAG: 1-acyl-sn-glycerol-3-phosphate acyltransferase [Bacteroidota bacterium]